MCHHFLIEWHLTVSFVNKIVKRVIISKNLAPDYNFCHQTSELCNHFPEFVTQPLLFSAKYSDVSPFSPSETLNRFFCPQNSETCNHFYEFFTQIRLLSPKHFDVSPFSHSVTPNRFFCQQKSETCNHFPEFVAPILPLSPNKLRSVTIYSQWDTQPLLLSTKQWND